MLCWETFHRIYIFSSISHHSSDQWSYIGWQNLNLLSHPKYNTSASRMASNAKWWNFELLAELLVWYPKVRSLLQTVEIEYGTLIWIEQDVMDCRVLYTWYECETAEKKLLFKDLILNHQSFYLQPQNVYYIMKASHSDVDDVTCN